MVIYQDEFPALEGVGLAIIALPDINLVGGKEQDQQQPHWAEPIRAALYKLYRSEQGQLKAADLGNLKPGPTKEQTLLRVQHVLDSLHEAGIKTLILAPNHAYTLQQLDAACARLVQAQLEEEEAEYIKPRLCIIDASIDASFEVSAADEHSFLNELLLNHKYPIDDFALVAHQTYLCEPNVLDILQALDFQTIRLGEHRNNTNMAAAALRHSHVVSIDLKACNSITVPGCGHFSSFGLSAEELCSLLWQTGHSATNLSTGIYGYVPANDINGTGAQVIATAIWHWLTARRIQQHGSSMERIHVLYPGFEDLRFYKHPQHGLYWVGKETDSEKQVHSWYAITESDFEEAALGQLTESLHRILRRLSRQKVAKKAKP